MAIIGVALATNAQTAERVIVTMSCDPSVVVGSLVYQSTSVDNLAIPATDNLGVPQVIGICTNKVNATTAKILLLGIVTGLSGFSVGARIFLSSTGTLTTTRPTTGYLHNLGVALSSTEALFIPNNIRVLQA